MEHTKEPWGPGVEIFMSAKAGEKFGPAFIYPHGHSQELCEANARRIVACINACAGLETEYLETVGLPEFVGKTLCADIAQQELDAVTAQRNELQQQLTTERASLFAESQRKQQLEQQVAELLTSLGAASNYIDHIGGLSNGYRAVIQKVRGGE